MMEENFTFNPIMCMDSEDRNSFTSLSACDIFGTMKIGGLYKAKEWEWIVYSSVQEAEKVGIELSPATSKFANILWIKQTYGIDVSLLEGLFVPLEWERKYHLKILESSGKIGWLILGTSTGTRSECFTQIA